ncbi:MAG: DUF5706 domain-containing protein [Gemmatimonadaceae bacterium]|nr:DUF5706 domain-containing protein [Gemmatimonadaceae bacterium]
MSSADRATASSPPPTAVPPDVVTMRPTPGWLAPESDTPDDGEQKRRKKEQKLREQAELPLDPYTRYKALSDALDSEQDLVELADKKARFALVIMGALNAAVLILASRGAFDLRLASNLPERAMIALLAIYALAALYYFVQAIEALRPRVGGRMAEPGPVRPGESAQVRYYQAIVARSAAKYAAAWQELRLDNLNAELASQVHVIAGINVKKYEALSRLYGGLKLMTILVALLLVDLAAASLIR